MADTAKQLKRGYKRNYGTIQAMIAEYQKATGKPVDVVQNLYVKNDIKKNTKTGRHKMPFKLPTEQSAFKFTVNGAGQPVGECTLWGGIPYMLVYPCCGMLHQLALNTALGAIVAPNCIVRTTYPKVYTEWLKRCPEAAQHRQVVAIFHTPALVDTKPLLPTIQTERPARRKAAA